MHAGPCSPSSLCAAWRSLRWRQPKPPDMSPRVLMRSDVSWSRPLQTTSLTGFLSAFLSDFGLSPGLGVGLCSVPSVACGSGGFRPRLAAASRFGLGVSATGQVRPPRLRHPLSCAADALPSAALPRFASAISSACFFASASRIAICSASTTGCRRGGGGSAGATAAAASRFTSTRFLRTST